MAATLLWTIRNMPVLQAYNILQIELPHCEAERELLNIESLASYGIEVI